MIDLTKFPYNGLTNPQATTLTEAIATDPVEDGFVVITLKAAGGESLAAQARLFAQQLRSAAEDSGLGDITAYR